MQYLPTFEFYIEEAAAHLKSEYPLVSSLSQKERDLLKGLEKLEKSDDWKEKGMRVYGIKAHIKGTKKTVDFRIEAEQSEIDVVDAALSDPKKAQALMTALLK